MGTLPRRVVVVDDDPAVLESTVAVLESLGIEVRACADPRQAPALVEAFRPDVVLHDLLVPGLGVEDLLPRLRDLAERAKVVLFTASLEGKELLGRIPLEVLEKPFSVPQLVAVLRPNVPASA